MDAVELRPLAIGEILDVAIKIWRRHFGTLVRCTLVLVGPLQLVVALVQASLRNDSTGNFTRPGAQPNFAAHDFWAFVAGFLVIGVASYVVGLLATAANLKAVSEGYLGGTPEWRASLRFAFSRLRSLVWLAFSTTFLLGLGLVACVLPGVFFWAAWSVATPALLIEGFKGRAARKRSRELVRGRWWQVFLALVLGTLLNQIVATAISAPALALAFSSHGNSFGAFFVRAVAATVSGVITTPFLSAIVAVIYFDLRVRKEGFDLELLAERVGVAPPTGVQPMAPVVVASFDDQPPFWPPPPGWKPRSSGDAGPPG